MPFEGVKQAGDAVGLEKLAFRAGGGHRPAQGGAVQRVVIDNEEFVVHFARAKY